MISNSQISLENKYLAILTIYAEKVIDAIQIKSFYFTHNVNQKLFDLLIEEFEEKGIIDAECINNKLQSYEIDHFTNVISADIPMSNILQHFEEIQKELFINHKKRLTEDIYSKYKSGKITFDNYLKKLDIIQDALIEDEDGVMTEEEFDKNINTELIRIPLNHFQKLNETLELVQNDFLVVGANTGTGKSGFLLNLMNDLIEKYQCVYFNMEMSKSTIYKRMISIRADIPIKDVFIPKSDNQARLISKAKKDYIDNRVRILHRISDIDEIEMFIRRRKNKEKKHTIVFLDHLGLIQIGSNKSLYERITQVMQRLRQMCLKYDCTIIAACQLNRSSYGVEQLDLSMLKDSGEIENSASKIILLSRCKDFDKDCLEPEMLLDVCKNRDGMLNKIVAIYHKTKQTFDEKGY